MVDPSTTTVTEPPTTTTTAAVEVQGEIDDAALAALPDKDRGPRGGSAPITAVAAIIGGALLAIGGYAWYHRSSRYLPA